MSKNQKYSSTLSIKADADFSSLISSIEKVQNSMKAKMSGKDALGIEESLNKIKQLQEKLNIMRDRGFSSPKEINEYSRLMDQLINQATDVQSAFKRIHLTGLDKEVNKFDSELKQARRETANLENDFLKIAKEAAKGVDAIKSFEAELKETLETSTTLKQVQDKTTQSIKEQVQKQKELVKVKQQEVDKYSFKTQVPRVSSQSFSIKDNYSGDKSNAEVMRKVASAYNAALKSTAKDAESMYKVFENQLSGKGLELKSKSTAINKFREAFVNAFKDGDNAAKQAIVDLQDTENRLNSLEETSKNISKFFNQASVKKLFEQYQAGKISIEELTQSLKVAKEEAKNRELPESIQETGQELDNAAKKSLELQTSLNDVSNQQVQFDSLTDSVGNFVKRILSVTTAYQTLRRVVISTFSDIKNLDKAFGEIAMVTNYSISEMWQQYGTYAEMANRLGQTTQSVIEASGLYYQQGLKTAEVMKLTEDTMKLATLAGLDFKEATSQMTGALRAFHMEMDQGAHVTDVYASIAANAAVDVNGISEAMSATAAIAHSAGMSFENTSAMLATMVEATQEAPKNLGTAMKAIIARFTELKTNVAGTADSEFDDLDYNKVDKALKSVGISIKDAAGQFRNLDEVFLELSAKWNTLERNTQRYIATIAAGSRQQSRFIALMENYERTMELIQVADESAGKADQQFAKYSDTITYKLNRLKNAWEQTKTTIFTSEFYGDLLDIITKLVEKLEGLDWKKLLIAAPIAIAAGREMGKNWALGFKSGAALLKDQFSKLPNKKGLTTEELKTNYVSSKTKYSETTGLEQTKLLRNMRPEIAVEGKIKKELDGQLEVLNEISKKRAEINKQIENDNFLSEAERNEALKQKEEIEAQYSNAWKQYDDIAEGNTEDIKKFSQEANKSFEQAKQKRADLWKSQAWSALGSAAGMAAGTALTMGLMGTFNAKEISTTIGIESGITALTQALSGNIAGAAVSAGIGIVSGVTAWISSLSEKRAEKQRELNDEVYRYKKIIEADEEAQKKLNDEYNKTNTAFEQQKELYDSFKGASETYEELSKKVLLTEEEQEKLNEATAELIKLHPELVVGYNSQGKAILAMGDAWEAVKNSEEAYYNSLRQERAEAEAEALKGQYKIASDYYALDSRKKNQRRELYNGNAYATSDSFLGDITYQNINDYLKLGWSNNSSLTGNAAYWTIAFAEQYAEFEEEFIAAVNKVTNSHASTFKEAANKIGDSNDKESVWYEVAQKIEEDFKIWEKLDVVKIDDSQILQVAKNYQGAISNNLDILLGEFKGTENAKKQLIAILMQSNASTDQIKNILKQDPSKNAQDIAKDILGDNEKLRTQFEELTDYQLELISNYISNLGKVSIEESEKEVEKLKQMDVGDKIVEALTGKLNDTEEQGEKIREKIREIFGYGFDKSNLNNIFSKLPLAVQESLSKVLGNYSNEQANFITHGMEAFLKDFNLSSNSDIFAHLAGIDWKNTSLLDLTATKKEFIEFAKTVDVSVEDAEKYWASYKQYMITTGAIDLTKTINTDAIIDSLKNKLSEKLKSADGITNAVSTALENGFLNFSESEALKEACEAIGVNVSEYLSFNKANNGYSLDVQGLRAAIEESFNEEKIAGEVDALITEKETQLNLLEGYVQRNKAGKDIVKTEYDILKIMEKEAAMAYAIAHGGEVKNISSGIENIQINFKDNDDQQVLDYIEKEREAIEKLDRNKLFQDLADNWQAATAEMLNRYDKIINNSQEKLEEYFKNVQDATEKVEELTVDLDKKNRATQKAWKSYQESLYGTDNYKSSLDPLNNYEAVLDNITYKAKKAKDALEDLEPEDNVGNLLKTYANQVHQEVITRNAENEVIKKAMENTEKNLAQYSQYWQKFGDTYVLNMDKIASAKMPDDLKNEIESQVEQLRKWQKNLRDNEDTLDQLRKDFKESRKKALQSYVDLEKQVVEALKEQYQKEIDDLKNKYDAMSTADEDYLNSLEAAIEKERRLRQRQNEWDDLATKEKKLSLMQRDTSGANQLEVQKLQQEVEKDRTQLLDNTVDDIVNSLKEMYDLQKESREAELEYMESMLDNAELIRQANEIISSWQSSADAVNWFMQAKDLNAMSAAELELEKESWEKLYKAKELYEEQSNLKFDDYLKATQEEINKQLKTISETATTYTATSMNLVKQKIADAQESALDAYNNAVDAEKKAKEALQEAQNLLLKLQLELPPALVELVGVTLAAANSVYTKTVTGSSGISSFMRGVMDTVSGSHQSDNVIDTYSSNKNNSNIGSEQAKYQEEKGTNSYINSYKDTVGWFVGQAYDWSSKKPDGGIGQLQPEIYQYIKNNPEEFADMIRTQTGYTGEVYIHFDDKNKSVATSVKDKKGYRAYSSGGLVDYTGPAWVDGSPSRPEAFLSVDDTRLIGNLVNLLSDLPALNPNTTPSSISTSNIGDTTINLTVNFDSVSEDYDVERVVDIMKEKIVEAANYTGANVILNKR